jgi:hypothetical protein
MIGLKHPIKKHAKKGYDGANTLKWNLENEPFLFLLVVEKEANTPMLGVVENYMLL